ncbi:MAG: hypothetical protein NTU58_00010 [Candidatus Nealsonbacteria bacterium]|nr:hypothetical protein [Candidatus Nealsonbacteria bacterium]
MILRIDLGKKAEGEKLYYAIKKAVEEMGPNIGILGEDIEKQYEYEKEELIKEKIKSYKIQISKKAKIKKSKRKLFGKPVVTEIERFVGPLFILGEEKTDDFSELYFGKTYRNIDIAIIKTYNFAGCVYNPLKFFDPEKLHGLSYSIGYDAKGEEFKREVAPMLNELVEKIIKNLNKN